MLMRLLRELMRGHMIALAMGSRCGLVGVCGLVMKLCGAVVCTLRHIVFSSFRSMQIQNA